MTKILILAAMLLASPAVAHEPSIAEATGPSPTIENNSKQYSAMNWMCQDNTQWGNTLQSCYGFARAVADTLVLTGRACVPEQLSSKELADYGDKYLEDHPDRDYALDDSAAKLLIDAFTKKWPCVTANQERTRKTDVRETGHFPKEWQGVWCQDTRPMNDGDRVFLLRRDVACTSDAKTKFKEDASYEEMESGCELMDGVWNEKEKTYRALYECWGEGSRSIVRQDLAVDNTGVMTITNKGSLGSPLDE